MIFDESSQKMKPDSHWSYLVPKQTIKRNFAVIKKIQICKIQYDLGLRKSDDELDN